MKSWKRGAVRDDGGPPCPVTGTWWCWKAKILFFSTYRMFRSPNVTRYFVIPWSVLAIHHAELQVKTGTQFKKLSLLTCLPVLLNPRRAASMGYAQGWVCNHHVPTLVCGTEAKRWGRAPVRPAEASRPPAWDGHVWAPCWEPVRGFPLSQHLWVKPRYVEGEVGFAYLCHRVVWRKCSANWGTFLPCKIMWGISSAGRTPGALWEGTFLSQKLEKVKIWLLAACYLYTWRYSPRQPSYIEPKEYLF